MPLQMRSMLDRAILHLTLIVEAVDIIRSHVAGQDRESFLSNGLVQDGVAMRFQVIGEAARHLSESERAEAPEIPWSQIVNVRHRISHDYRNVNFAMVWDIVQNELGPLQTAAKKMLAARGE